MAALSTLATPHANFISLRSGSDLLTIMRGDGLAWERAGTCRTRDYDVSDSSLMSPGPGSQHSSIIVQPTSASQQLQLSSPSSQLHSTTPSPPPPLPPLSSPQPHLQPEGGGGGEESKSSSSFRRRMFVNSRRNAQTNVDCANLSIRFDNDGNDPNSVTSNPNLGNYSSNNNNNNQPLPPTLALNTQQQPPSPGRHMAANPLRVQPLPQSANGADEAAVAGENASLLNIYGQNNNNNNNELIEHLIDTNNNYINPDPVDLFYQQQQQQQQHMTYMQPYEMTCAMCEATVSSDCERSGVACDELMMMTGDDGVGGGGGSMALLDPSFIPPLVRKTLLDIHRQAVCSKSDTNIKDRYRSTNHLLHNPDHMIKASSSYAKLRTSKASGGGAAVTAIAHKTTKSGSHHHHHHHHQHQQQHQNQKMSLGSAKKKMSISANPLTNLSTIYGEIRAKLFHQASSSSSASAASHAAPPPPPPTAATIVATVNNAAATISATTATATSTSTYAPPPLPRPLTPVRHSTDGVPASVAERRPHATTTGSISDVVWPPCVASASSSSSSATAASAPVASPNPPANTTSPSASFSSEPHASVSASTASGAGGGGSRRPTNDKAGTISFSGSSLQSQTTVILNPDFDLNKSS